MTWTSESAHAEAAPALSAGAAFGISATLGIWAAFGIWANCRPAYWRPAATLQGPVVRASYATGPLGWIILGMNPPTEQLIRDYLNRLSVAARGRLGISQRQSLLDRTRARIEAECGGINGAGAVEVRKALADLGDPIVLVELEASQVGSGTSTADTRYEPSVAGNGHKEMAAGQAHANETAKGSEIGEELLVTGGPNGSKPGRGGGSIRSLLAGLASGQRRRRRDGEASKPDTQSTSRGNSGSGQRPPGLVPAPRRPTASEQIGQADLLAAPQQPGPSPSRDPDPGQGRRASARPRAGQGKRASASGAEQQSRLAGSTSASAQVPARLIRGIGAAARDHTLEFLAIVLLGVGGAAYPPIWLVGAGLALPSKKWDIRDKFVGVTLPVVLLIIGTVLVLVLGGEHASLTAYAYEAWLGAERLSRVLAAAGATYLAWRLRRGRREPKQPPWNVPHRIG